MSLKEKTQTLFADAFGYPASHVIQAPGRVNLIGEHTGLQRRFCAAMRYRLPDGDQLCAARRSYRAGDCRRLRQSDR